MIQSAAGAPKDTSGCWKTEAVPPDHAFQPMPLSPLRGLSAAAELGRRAHGRARDGGLRARPIGPGARNLSHRDHGNKRIDAGCNGRINDAKKCRTEVVVPFEFA